MNNNRDNQLVRQQAQGLAARYKGQVQRVYATRDEKGGYVFKVTPVDGVLAVLPPTIVIRPGLIAKVEVMAVMARPKIEPPQTAKRPATNKAVKSRSKRSVPPLEEPRIPPPVLPKGNRRPAPKTRRVPTPQVKPPRPEPRMVPPRNKPTERMKLPGGTTGGRKTSGDIPMALDWAGRKPATMPANKDFGEHPDLAQTWTPPWLADLFWRGMYSCGFSPKTHPLVYDLAVGNGRLVEQIKDTGVRLVVNDVDPGLEKELKRKFPKPHRVIIGDFRKLRHLPQTSIIVGSPPWMDAGGEYLPQAYVTLAERLLKPGGLLGILVPEDFRPRTNLKLLREVELSQADREKITDWGVHPVLLYYQK